MQTTSIKVLNKTYVQIYVTEEELGKKEINDMIQKYKSEKCKVGIFVNGKENYLEFIRKIITKQDGIEKTYNNIEY